MVQIGHIDGILLHNYLFELSLVSATQYVLKKWNIESKIFYSL